MTGQGRSGVVLAVWPKGGELWAMTTLEQTCLFPETLPNGGEPTYGYRVCDCGRYSQETQGLCACGRQR